MMHDLKPAGVVLVVDDSPETLGFLTDALHAAGMTVLISIDGENALALLNEVTPDVILLDAVMPGLDGFETCRRMKRDTRFAHVPVIFMTGLTETEHVIEGLEAGGVDYVTKPIITDELIARIRVHRNNARVAHSARQALNAAGRALLAASAHGRVLWNTPQAASLLQKAFPAAEVESLMLPTPVADWLATAAANGEPPEPSVILSPDNGLPLSFSFVAVIAPDELLLAVHSARTIDEKTVFKERFTLTPREAEVLLWIARGKSNRDVAEILDLSPRTVNKHLEQVYAKLGVENRTAAAAVALSALGK